MPHIRPRANAGNMPSAIRLDPVLNPDLEWNVPTSMNQAAYDASMMNFHLEYDRGGSKRPWYFDLPASAYQTHIKRSFDLLSRTAEIVLGYPKEEQRIGDYAMLSVHDIVSNNPRVSIKSINTIYTTIVPRGLLFANQHIDPNILSTAQAIGEERWGKTHGHFKKQFMLNREQIVTSHVLAAPYPEEPIIQINPPSIILN